MQGKNILDLLNAEKSGIVDYKNPDCKDCNDCCSLFIQISEEEYKDLKKYFTKNKVGISKYQSAVLRFHTMAKELKGVYLVCPFSDRNKKCTIYSKRPEICKSFHCSKGEKEFDLMSVNQYTLFDLLKEDIKNEKMFSLFVESFLGQMSSGNIDLTDFASK